MKEKYKELIVIVLFSLLSIFIFRNYFLKNSIPFPANLLISYYQPWSSYSWEGYPNGPPNKPIGFDNLRIFYPLRSLTTDQIKNFELPLWNPYNFSGNTQLATYQSAVFHPLGLLFFILPQIDAYSLIIILQPFLSAVFMYFFLKEISLSRKASFFGAVTFAFSGFMVVWWEESFMSVYSALFLPLILFSIEKLFKKINLFHFFILTFSLSFSILSGWFQMSFYVWIFSILWIIFSYFKTSKKENQSLFYIFTAYVLGIFISGVHLIPSFEAYFYSARGTTDAKFIFDNYFAPLHHLITFISPDFFGSPSVHNYFGGKSFYHEKVIFVGIIPLFFALYEFFNFKDKKNMSRFIKISWIITLSLGFSLPTSWLFLYYLKIPLISVILPSRIFFLSAFCISILGAFGLESFFKEINKKRIIFTLSIVSIAMLLVWVLAIYFKYKVYPDPSIYSVVPIKNLIVPSFVYFLFILIIIFYSKFKQFKTVAYLFIVCVALFSSLYFANKYLYFSERKFVYPKVPVIEALKKNGIDRFWGVGNGYFERNFATQFSLFSPEGYDSFYIGRYGELLFAGQNKGKFSKQIPRTDATISGVRSLNEISDNFYRERLISLLGVKYLVADNMSISQDKLGVQSFKKLWEDNIFTIYENEKAFPRAFISGNYLVLKNEQEILDKIFDKNFDLTRSIVLEEKPENFTKTGSVNSKLELISYKPNKIIFKEEANKKSLFYLSDNYYPGWKAYVDGIETKVLRANYSFRSIVIPPGKHTLIFEYKPFSFYLGGLSSIFGLLIFLIIGFKIKSDKLNK
ncbi:hypothetical protein C4559_03290 [Candidatus Microgenomates bacterium]|nr:MAG: hypothetical protein C4559_03290 [Candidatus Microgenomates bacterium]